MKYLVLMLVAVSAFAQPDKRLAYEVISIKRHPPGAPVFGNDPLSEGGRLRFGGMPVSAFLTAAFREPGAPHQLKRSQFIGLPEWVDTDRFDVEAKPEPGFVPTYDQAVSMIRTLLEDRFALKFRRESRESPVFNLTLIKDRAPEKTGVQLSDDQTPVNRNPTTTGSPGAAATGPAPLKRGEARANFRDRPGVFQVSANTMAEFAAFLSLSTDRQVIDHTAMKGLYDFELKYTPDYYRQLPETYRQPQGVTVPEPDGPTLFEALQQQLGMKLEAARGPVETIIVEHIERPEEN